jgi:hypothetical protein
MKIIFLTLMEIYAEISKELKIPKETERSWIKGKYKPKLAK